MILSSTCENQRNHSHSHEGGSRRLNSVEWLILLMGVRYSKIHIEYDYTCSPRVVRASEAYLVCKNCGRKCTHKELYKTHMPNSRLNGACFVCVQYNLVLDQRIRKFIDINFELYNIKRLLKTQKL